MDHHLESLPRKKLQALCKAASIKANLKTTELIASLKAHYARESSLDEKTNITEEVVSTPTPVTKPQVPPATTASSESPRKPSCPTPPHHSSESLGETFTSPGNDSIVGGVVVPLTPDSPGVAGDATGRKQIAKRSPGKGPGKNKTSDKVTRKIGDKLSVVQKPKPTVQKKTGRVINFDKIHKRQFENAESIEAYAARMAARKALAKKAPNTPVSQPSKPSPGPAAKQPTAAPNKRAVSQPSLSASTKHLASTPTKTLMTPTKPLMKTPTKSLTTAPTKPLATTPTKTLTNTPIKTQTKAAAPAPAESKSSLQRSPCLASAAVAKSTSAPASKANSSTATAPRKHHVENGISFSIGSPVPTKAAKASARRRERERSPSPFADMRSPTKAGSPWRTHPQVAKTFGNTSPRAQKIAPQPREQHPDTTHSCKAARDSAAKKSAAVGKFEADPNSMFSPKVTPAPKRQFSLEESLKRPLSWKLKTGRYTYSEKENSQPVINQPGKPQPPKKVSLHDRAAASKRSKAQVLQANRRQTALDAKRGM